MAEPHSIDELVDLLHRTRASLLEEGTWADRADELGITIRLDGSVHMGFVGPAGGPRIDAVFEKAMSIDPVYKVGKSEYGREPGGSRMEADE